MKTYQYTVVIEPDDDAFHAFAPALPGCHSYGQNLDEARKNIAEAIALHLECMQEDGESLPVEGEPFVITRLTVPLAA